MTFDSALFDPTHLCLEIDARLQAQAWRQSQAFVTPASQWNAYLNQLCLHTLLPWIREEIPQVTIQPAQAIWELTNGAALVWANRRIVLIPTETIDLDEIRIPQEWVDVPNWIADYYLAVQVNPDHAWVRVAGFVTHHQLRQKAQLDYSDRTYCLDGADLIPDLSILWLSQQLAAEPTRATVAELTALTATEADSLIQRLGNPTLITPRLAIPFQRWAALIANADWRQQLAERRRGSERRSVWQWLQSGISTLTGWERIDYQPAAAARSSEAQAPVAALSRQITIASQRYELHIVPVDLGANIWRFELNSLAPGGLIPTGTTLRLLPADRQPFADNEDRATAPVEQLYIEVALESGEALIWEVDPTPESYEPEILWF
jgi:hypothetical protein